MMPNYTLPYINDLVEGRVAGDKSVGYKHPGHPDQSVHSRGGATASLGPLSAKRAFGMAQDARSKANKAHPSFRKGDDALREGQRLERGGDLNNALKLYKRAEAHFVEAR